MKLFNYISAAGPCLGVAIDGKYYVAETPLSAAVTDDVIAGALSPADIKPGAQLPDSIRFAPAVAYPDKIICAGLNYRDHAEETGGEAPAQPVIFDKLTDSLAAHMQDVPAPETVRCLDYEAELVAIVGKEAYNVSVQEAEECIFGYACGNDLSARDSQFLSNQWLIGKTFPAFAPLGPLLVTKDEVDAKNLKITCTLNGNIVQNSNTGNMIFTPAEIFSFASKYMRFYPGDLIYTGTPSGVILGKPKGSRVWMKAGDVVTVSIEGLGELTNKIV